MSADLISLAGIAALAGVSRQRAWQLSRHPQFPPPVPIQGGTRNVWNTADVRVFLAAERKPGRPATRGPGQSRTGNSDAAAPHQPHPTATSADHPPTKTVPSQQTGHTDHTARHRFLP